MSWSADFTKCAASWKPIAFPRFNAASYESSVSSFPFSSKTWNCSSSWSIASFTRSRAAMLIKRRPSRRVSREARPRQYRREGPRALRRTVRSDDHVLLRRGLHRPDHQREAAEDVIAFLAREPIKRPVEDARSEPLEVVEEPLALFGKTHSLRPPVLGMLLALDEPQLHEAVHEAARRRDRAPERLSELVHRRLSLGPEVEDRRQLWIGKLGLAERAIGAQRE